MPNPRLKKIIAEINGYNVDDRKQLVSGYKELKSDGSTACGCWIYSGVMPSPDREQGAQARAQGSLWARMGLRVAKRSPDFVQPGICASGRETLERAQGAGLVGCGTKEVDWSRHSRFHREQAARLSARKGREG